MSINFNVAFTAYSTFKDNYSVTDGSEEPKHNIDNIKALQADMYDYQYKSENTIMTPETFSDFITEGDDVCIVRSIYNIPKIAIMFSDKDITKLKKNKVNQLLSCVLKENMFVKNVTPSFDLNGSVEDIHKQGKAFLYKIVSNNNTTTFDNITCYTENCEMYSGTTNENKLSENIKFSKLDEWSSFGMMYVILKNKKNPKIPFKLALV